MKITAISCKWSHFFDLYFFCCHSPRFVNQSFLPFYWHIATVDFISFHYGLKEKKIQVKLVSITHICVWLNHVTNAALSFKFLECQCKQFKMEFSSPLFFPVRITFYVDFVQTSWLSFSGNFILYSFLCVFFFVPATVSTSFWIQSITACWLTSNENCQIFQHLSLCTLLKAKKKKKWTKSRKSCGGGRDSDGGNKRATERSRLAWIPFS